MRRHRDRLVRLRDREASRHIGCRIAEIYASLTPDQIEEVTRIPSVERIVISPKLENKVDVAKPTVGADYMNSSLGITGSGIKVAEVEVGGKVDKSNPLIGGSTITIDPAANLCYPDSFPPHSTGVAGIMHSSRGIAPGTSLFATGDCFGDGDKLMARASYSVTATTSGGWGATVQNNSWGNTAEGEPTTELNDLDKYFDALWLKSYATLVFAAGNEGGTFESGNVMSPGRAYNVITVGNYDDANTKSWADDQMSNSSSWRNPYSTYGDREKPELAAPGDNSVRTGAGPCEAYDFHCNYYSTVPVSTSVEWGNASGWGSIGEGTSYAAPVVSGAAALLQQRQPTLKAWPEAVKAILMATAVGNPDGQPPNYTVDGDESDGAGGIWIPYADNAARGVKGSWKAMAYSCSTATPLSLVTMNLAAGRAARAVIVWDQNPNYVDYFYRPSADLDLKVLSPSGAVVAQSLSADNTFELVSFTPSVSGTYTIRVVKDSCALTPNWLAGAWSQP